MLNIFRGKASSPSYRLIAPADGELQTITVHKEVRLDSLLQNHFIISPLTISLDIANKTLRLGRRAPQHQVHQREI